MTQVNRKDVLTTGEVAEICHVAPRTVSKWFDSGKLKGYRIPGSRDRRIPREQLIAFMTAHGMPLEGLDGGTCRVLVVAETLDEVLIEAFQQSDRYDLRRAGNGFEAGVLANQMRPHVVLLPADRDDASVAGLCQNVKEATAAGVTKVVAACSQLDEAQTRFLREHGFDDALVRPFTFAELAAVIERVTHIF